MKNNGVDEYLAKLHAKYLFPSGVNIKCAKPYCNNNDV